MEDGSRAGVTRDSRPSLPDDFSRESIQVGDRAGRPVVVSVRLRTLVRSVWFAGVVAS
ncbi:hypothetical protein [Actinomadura fibrosa]|uniref:hypothetical protein n=1 Tax=Actinomadura fibrosa TaxID=111802 RepID=UPI0013F16CCA|nr:hypothetical protein [Actinomadura fibrosa]